MHHPFLTPSHSAGHTQQTRFPLLTPLHTIHSWSSKRATPRSTFNCLSVFPENMDTGLVGLITGASTLGRAWVCGDLRKLTGDAWVMAAFSKLGFIGKLFHSSRRGWGLTGTSARRSYVGETYTGISWEGTEPGSVFWGEGRGEDGGECFSEFW